MIIIDPKVKAEILLALDSVAQSKEKLAEVGIFDRLFKTDIYDGYKRILDVALGLLERTVNKTPEHTEVAREVLGNLPTSHVCYAELNGYLKATVQ